MTVKSAFVHWWLGMTIKETTFNPAEQGIAPVILLLGFVSNVIVLAAFYFGWGDFVPIGVRLLAATISMTLAPGSIGLLLFFRKKEQQKVDGIAEFLFIFVIGFSFNLLINIILYITNVSLAEALAVYLPLQILFSGWLLYSRGGALQRVSWRLIGIREAAIAVGLAVLAFVTYQHGYPLTNNEELFVLQKLATNPSVAYDNISVTSGQPSTYFFVPFQLLIAGVSILAGFEVSFTQSLFWPFTTIVGILAMLKIAEVVSSDRMVVGAMAGLIFVISIFQPSAFIEQAGIVIPYPNRHGIASGVLLPLVLWLYWDLLGRRKTDYLSAFALGYVILELTFVHARETLIALACIVITGLVYLISSSKSGRDLRVILGVVATTVVILVGYKVLVLLVSNDLDAYIGAMKIKMLDILQARFAGGSVFEGLFSPLPRSFDIAVGQTGSLFSVGITSYDEIFQESWVLGGKSARIFIPIAVLFLPIYILVQRTVLPLAVAACLSAFAIVMKIPGLELALSYIVGNPEIFRIYNIVFLLSLIVFAHGLVIFARWLVCHLERCGAGRGIILFSVLFFLITLSIWLSTSDLRRFTMGVNILSGIWTANASFVLHLFSLGLIIFRALSPLTALNRPIDHAQPYRAHGAYLGITLGAFIIAYSIPVAMDDKPWKDGLFLAPYPPGSFSGRFDEDFDRLVASGKIKSRLPVDVIQFLRNKVPANQNLISGESNTVSMTTNHFTPVDTAADQPITGVNVSNWKFMQFLGPGVDRFDLRLLVEPEGENKRLIDILNDFRVDLILVLPYERDHVTMARKSNKVIEILLNPLFDNGSYAIYGVRSAATALPHMVQEKSASPSGN
jgi:hypothetical protein